MTPEDFDKAAEKCAQKLIQAAGSNLAHYMPQTRVKILWEAREFLQETYRAGFKHGMSVTPPTN